MDQIKGYVLLFKQIQDNWLWADVPFAKGQAWIDLLLMANFKDGQMMVKGVVVDIKRGQVFRTTDYLAKRWGWSRGKVLRFLKILENQKMATLTGLPNGTLITIENYNSYQLEQTPDDTPDDTSSVQARYKLDTQKNKEKERINKNKNIYRGFTPPTIEEVSAYCIERGNQVDPEEFVDFYSSKGWMVGKNRMKDWRAAVRNWERNSASKSSKNDLDDFYKMSREWAQGG